MNADQSDDLSFRIHHSSFIIPLPVPTISEKFRKFRRTFRCCQLMFLLPGIVNQFRAQKQVKNETTTRTFEFTVEKTETLAIRRDLRIVANWCSACSHDAKMTRPEDAALITGIRTRKIYSKIEAGSAHFSESADGLLLVCLLSLETVP